MLYKSLALLFLIIYLSQNRFIYYISNNFCVLIDEDITRFILPQAFTFRNIEEIYTKNFSLLSLNSTSYYLIRSISCKNLFSLLYLAPKDHIQINTFEIRVNDNEAIIGLFRVEIHDDTSEHKVVLESIDSDLKMYINIISKNDKGKNDEVTKYENNFFFGENPNIASDCIFIKAKKLSLFLKLPYIVKRNYKNINYMIRWIITWEYTYQNQLVNGSTEYYALRTYCGDEPRSVDFVLKHNPHNVKIKLFATTTGIKKVFDIGFSYESGKIAVNVDPNKGEIGFEPRVYDINKALLKNNSIPSLVLEPLVIWGSCSSKSHKLVNIQIFERFGFKYFHYGLYPFSHINNSNILTWKPLSYTDLNDKVTNNEITCQQQL